MIIVSSVKSLLVKNKDNKDDKNKEKIFDYFNLIIFKFSLLICYMAN